jgi:hypothetical protein
MAIRTINSVLYRRNRAFWLRRQQRGDEIRVTRLQRVFTILYGLRPRPPLRRRIRPA